MKETLKVIMKSMKQKMVVWTDKIAVDQNPVYRFWS